MSQFLDACTSDNLYWRPEYADDETSPQKIEGSLRGGTYRTKPYLVFATAGEGNVHLVSDGKLDLVVSEDLATDPSGATLKVKSAAKGAADWSTTRLIIEEGGFLVRASIDEKELPSGSYRQTARLEEAHMAQKLGDVFVTTEMQFSTVQKAFNVTEMFLEEPGARTSALDLFLRPDGDSKRYGMAGHFVTPFGWKFAPDSVKYGDFRTSVISNAQELHNATKEVFGDHQAFDLFGLKFARSSNTAESNQLESVLRQELTLTTHRNVLTSHAMVLDKTNVALSSDFYRSILEFKASGNFEDFCNHFGTHFSNATTFGSKGSLTRTYTDHQITQIRASGLDVKSTAEFGLSEEFEGLKLGSSNTTETENSKDKSEKIDQILGSEAVHYQCIGDCSNGDPTAASLVPVMLDLRPISDLISPPFFREYSLIGSHAGSLRIRLAECIKNYAYFQLDDKDVSKPRFYRLTYDSNRVEQSQYADNVVSRVEVGEFGGHQVVDNVPGLASFKVSQGGKTLAPAMELHDSLVVTPEPLKVSIDLVISKYVDAIGFPPNPWNPYLIPRVELVMPATGPAPWTVLPRNIYASSYDIAEEMNFYRQTGMARTISYDIHPATEGPNVPTTMLPVLMQMTTVKQPGCLAGRVWFTCVPITTVAALGLA